jgi:hypothetical protein
MVFNTSLTDCGAHGQICPQHCNQGVCDPEPVVFTDAGVDAAAILDAGVITLAVSSNDEALVWADPFHQAIKGCSLDNSSPTVPTCGAVVTLATGTGSKYPSSVLYAAGSSNFIWVNTDGTVGYVPISLQSPQKFVGATVGGLLALDAQGAVYWASANHVYSLLPTAGTPTVVLGPGAGPDGGTLRDPQISPDGVHLVWDDVLEAQVCDLTQIPEAGGCDMSTSYPSVGIVPDGGTTVGIRRAGTQFLYYAEGPILNRTAYDKPDAGEQYTGGPGIYFAVADDALYFSTGPENAVLRAKEACPFSATLTMAVSESAQIRAIAVSKKYVYWIDANQAFFRVGR